MIKFYWGATTGTIMIKSYDKYKLFAESKRSKFSDNRFVEFDTIVSIILNDINGLYASIIAAYAVHYNHNVVVFVTLKRRSKNISITIREDSMTIEIQHLTIHGTKYHEKVVNFFDYTHIRDYIR